MTKEDTKTQQQLNKKKWLNFPFQELQRVVYQNKGVINVVGFLKEGSYVSSKLPLWCDLAVSLQYSFTTSD